MLLTEKKALLVACVLIVACASATESQSIRRLLMGTVQQVWSEGKPIQEVEKDLQVVRVRRQSSDSPVIHGDHQFNDGNNYAAIHYSGNSSPVILVLTYRFSGTSGFQGNSNIYRSINYGASFTAIEDQLDSSNPNPSLWRDIYVSSTNKNLVVVYNANQPQFYYSFDEGLTWTTQTISPSTINPRSLSWNSVNDRMALGHDPVNNQLYVTQNLGATWTKIAENVFSTDYQWGDPAFDQVNSVVYFNTYDPTDTNQGDFTVSLNTQRIPFNSDSQQEFDANLGRHDAFLLIGAYIFAQKTNSEGVISLYVSYNRQPFQKAMIPSTDPHQNYIVSHIDQQQAMVIVEHSSTQFNLYISDVTGVYFTLSLPDIVTESSGIDLELIEGVNGTLVANQYVRSDPSDQTGASRSLISLDNGGNWELVRGPASPDCIHPQCSLHFHMTTSAYARTGVYSQASAPGIIIAHGNLGTFLNSDNPDLYISRDGGVSWVLTLVGSWGVTVADHGGLLVAARDYHQTPSTELRYSCDEGINWSDFVFSTTPMVVYGVVTEPGEHTTTISFYGVKQGTFTWDVVTVNFSSIFPSTCSGSEYYYWHPWDDRTDEECILGSSVTIERRNASICCLIGQDYSRPIQFSVCPCFDDDFECDYGYMRSEGFTGPCIRDSSISLPATCVGNVSIYSESQGYRKVAGDVCVGGLEASFSPLSRPCCGDHGVNECLRQPSPCDAHASCTDTDASYQCTCQVGYSGDGLTAGSGCSDINECSSSPCDDNAQCINTVGSFMCNCNEGFIGCGLVCYNSDTDCTRLSCDASAQCVYNQTTGYRCECGWGYVGDGRLTGCHIPQDGCDRFSPCDGHATCSMEQNTYKCQCLPGYSGDGFSSGSKCTNVNECSSQPCVSNATCTDTDGSFFCRCKPGFLGDGIASGGSGCQAQTGSIKSQNTSIAPLVVVSVLLVIALAVIIVLIIVVVKMHSDLKKCRGSAHSVGGIHYRNTQAEEQPLTWNNPQDDDDDDEPLLT